jgi:multiple antibiotic resistance protein
MVFEKRTEKREDRAEGLLEEISDPEDISVFPMGIPMIAGPGTMASLLILSSDAGNGLPQQLAVMAALGLVLLITLIAFLVSGFIMKLMGKTFTNVLTRVLGVLLATLAAQFILDGLKNTFF